MITVEDVTKVHTKGQTEVSVLRGLSFDIAPGSFAFIVGPSGSGKSTLMYLIGALDEPTSGVVRINGKSLGEMTEADRDRVRRDDIGFIFQSFNLLSNLDAVDNVLVPYLPTKRASQLRPAAVDLLTRVGLGDRLDHRPNRLSGGEQQRVAIARALLKQPSLVLADEPTGELDTDNGAEVYRYLRELQQEQGTTTIVVTHDLRYIEPDDRVLTICDGRIVEGKD